MSTNPNQICRNTYFNYGSYLRSRGYDKFVCNLLTEIENGLISIGPITPHGTCGADMRGSFIINTCDVSANNDTNDYDLGRLVVNGGWCGTASAVAEENITSSGNFTNGPQHFSIQAEYGINSSGPIFSTNQVSNYAPYYTETLYGESPLVNTNVFIADNTYFYGADAASGSAPGDSLHNVRISGDTHVYNDIQCDGSLNVVGNSNLDNYNYLGLGGTTYSMEVRPYDTQTVDPTLAGGIIYMYDLPIERYRILTVDERGQVFRAPVLLSTLMDAITALEVKTFGAAQTDFETDYSPRF